MVAPELLAITAVVPPASMYNTASIGVFAEWAGKVVYTGVITPDGNVLQSKPLAEPAGSGPAGEFQYVCKPHVLAVGKVFMGTMNASVNPAGGQSAPDASGVKQ